MRFACALAKRAVYDRGIVAVSSVLGTYQPDDAEFINSQIDNFRTGILFHQGFHDLTR